MNSTCVLDVFSLPLTLFTQNVMRIGVFVTRGYRGQPRPQSNYCRVGLRAQGVNLFMT